MAQLGRRMAGWKRLEGLGGWKRLAALASASLACCSVAAPAPWQPWTLRFGSKHTASWAPLNDGVMGGRSSGHVVWADDAMVWEGETSLANNGGFASVRSPWGETDLQGMAEVVVTCRGTGGPFKFTLETSSQWWLPYAYASFEPAETWNEVVLPLRAFRWNMARVGDLHGVKSRDVSRVLRMGVMKYDGTAAPFHLEIRAVEFR